MSKHTNIFLVDDHAVLRKGLSLLLKVNPKNKIVGEANSYASAISLIPTLNIDVLITDISLTKETGLDLVKYVNKHFPEIRTIVLSMHVDDSYILSAMTNGALAYISKEENEELILEAIDTVGENRLFLTPSVSNIIAKNAISQSKKAEAEAKLTKREKQTLISIVNGDSNKIIASNLNISEKTVGVHRYNLMKKLNAKNTAELVRITFEKNILEEH